MNAQELASNVGSIGFFSFDIFTAVSYFSGFFVVLYFMLCMTLVFLAFFYERKIPSWGILYAGLFVGMSIICGLYLFKFEVKPIHAAGLSLIAHLITRTCALKTEKKFKLEFPTIYNDIIEDEKQT